MESITFFKSIFPHTRGRPRPQVTRSLTLAPSQGETPCNPRRSAEPLRCAPCKHPLRQRASDTPFGRAGCSLPSFLLAHGSTSWPCSTLSGVCQRLRRRQAFLSAGASKYPDGNKGGCFKFLIIKYFNFKYYFIIAVFLGRCVLGLRRPPLRGVGGWGRVAAPSRALGASPLRRGRAPTPQSGSG